MIEILFSQPIVFLILMVALVLAVTIHEFAHAYVADKLGDPTPRAYGRVTLNPLAHLDPIGTLALLIARIGWGKPVPVDPYNFENPKRDSMLVSLAGPGSNFILALILAVLTQIFPQYGQIFIIAMSLNVGLGVFNLLPIPPLDGSKVLTGLLPHRQAYEWESFTKRNSWYLLILFILPILGGRSLASIIISPIIGFIINLILSGAVFGFRLIAG